MPERRLVEGGTKGAEEYTARQVIGVALPPKTAVELEDELSKAHAMLGRALLLLVTRTDLTGAEIGAAIMDPETSAAVADASL